MTLTGVDVAEHNSAESCWVIVHGKAYDVTEFLPGTVSSPLSKIWATLLAEARGARPDLPIYPYETKAKKEKRKVHISIPLDFPASGSTEELLFSASHEG